MPSWYWILHFFFFFYQQLVTKIVQMKLDKDLEQRVYSKRLNAQICINIKLITHNRSITKESFHAFSKKECHRVIINGKYEKNESVKINFNLLIFYRILWTYKVPKLMLHLKQ